MRNKKGFSLLEIVVAISIFATVFFGLLNIYPVGLSITGSAENKTVASFLAQAKVEQLRDQGYNNLEAGVVEEKEELTSDGDDYRYGYERESRVVNVDKELEETEEETGLKKIITTVYYPNSVTKKEESFRLITLISE